MFRTDWIFKNINSKLCCFRLDIVRIFLVVLIIILSTNNCLPPPKPIIFNVNQKKKNNYEFKLLDNKIIVEIGGNGRLNEYIKRYTLFLGVEVKYSKNDKNISFYPNNIEIYLNDIQLSKVQKQGGDTFNLKESKGSYINGFDYYLILDDDQLCEFSKMKHELIFILNGFIIVEGKPIYVEPITGYDPTIIISKDLCS